MENVEIPNQNTQVNSFSFEIQPAWKLEFAIRALCDLTFNSEGLAWINARLDYFNFSVWDSETQFGAYIFVDRNVQNKYCCSNPFNSKMINLKSVLSVFDSAASHDTVTIRHVHGSAEILFKFGTDSEFPVQLIEAEFPDRDIPDSTFDCETVMKSQHLVEMIPRLVQRTPQTVFVHVKDEKLTINVGVKKWEDKLRPLQQNSGRELDVLFKWPHVESLRNAVVLHRSFALRFESSGVPAAATLLLSFLITEGCNLDFRSCKGCLTYSFKFQAQLGDALKCALKSLTVSDFIQGIHSRVGALIEVNNEGCEITVENRETGVSGFLRFKASDLINFKCIRTLEKAKIDIKRIGLYMFTKKEDDILTVYSVPGTNVINFESGRLSFSAKLQELDPNFVGVSLNLNNVCSVKIPSEHLRRLIRLMNQNRQLQTVSLEIRDGLATFSVDQLRLIPSYHDPELLGKSHHVSFNCPIPGALFQASKLSEHFIVHLQDNPTDSISLEFDLPGGKLVYQKGVQRLNCCTSGLVRKS